VPLGYGPYMLLPPLTVTAAVFMMIRIWRRRSAPIARTFLFLMAALAIWSLAVVLEEASLTLTTKIFWSKVSFLGVVTLPSAWLVFTLQYANREKWVTRRNLIIFSIIPVVTLVMVWTNDIYHLMWKEIWLDYSVSPPVDAVSHNIWFWVQATYSYLLILLGNITLLSVFLRSTGVYRKQVGILILATLVPWLANFAYIMGMKPFAVVDPTPLAFAITGAAFLWGLSRLQLLEIMPIANDAIFRNIGDGVIVIDGQNRIVEINPAAEHIVKRIRSKIVGQPYKMVLPWIDGRLDIKPDIAETQAAISFGEGQDQRYYTVNTSPILTKKQHSGYLILLHNDTNRLKEEAQSKERIRFETELIERNKSEQILRASETKFRNLIENAATGILVNLPDGEIISANKASLEIFGYDSEEQLKGKSVVGCYLDTGNRKAMLSLIEKNGVARGFEARMMRRDGTVFWGSLNVIIQKAASGETQFLTIIEDITKRKESEEQLRSSEKKYSELVEHSNDGIILIQNSRIVFTNLKMREMIDQAQENIIGKPFIEFITPEYKSYILDRYQKSLSGEKVPSNYEIEILSGENRKIPVEINASITEYDGRPADMAIVRDITDRKKAEIELKESRDLIDRIIASSPNAVLVINKEGRIVLSNRAFNSLHDRNRNDIDGQDIEKFDELKELLPLISEVQSGKLKDHQLEFECKIEGLDRFFLANIIPMEKEEVLLSLNETTEYHQRQAKLSLNERLVSVGEMASGVAHELNNPLTSVIGLSSLLIKEDLSQEVKEDLEAIYSEAKRAATIVKNLLTFARKHAPERQLTQLNIVLENVLKLRDYEHRVNNIQVKTKFDSDLPQVMVDQFQIQQVFLNLILNAEYSMIETHRQGILKLITRSVDGNVKVSITDDGAGISRENMKHLFNPFFTTKEVGKGTGLGLSICYGTVTNHGGKIYAESQPGQGATFVVELPIKSLQRGEINNVG
jgi:PAS domain S-box-containing protein